MSTPPRKKKRSTLRIMLIIGAIMIFLVVVISIVRTPNPTEVIVEQANQRTIVASVTESGVVEPAIEVKIAADVSGEVVELKFKEGDQVKRGDLLLTIQPDNYQSALEQAQAAVNGAIAAKMQAEAAFKQAKAAYLQDSANEARMRPLVKEKVISKLDYENAKLKFDISKSQMEGAFQSSRAAAFQETGARASLRQAKQNLQRTTIMASMSGTITRQNVEMGERVVGTLQMMGTEVIRIADLSKMLVTVDINENDIIHIRIGDTAHIEVDAYQDKIFKGRVSEIAYSASQGEMMQQVDQITNFEVKVEILPESYLNDKDVMGALRKDQSPFRPGMSAQVEIYTDIVEKTVAVPIQAVTVRRSEENPEAEPDEIVFIYEGGKVSSRKIKTGISDDRHIEIVSGLEPGLEIVSGPYLTLTKELEDGMKVSLLQEKKKRKQ